MNLLVQSVHGYTEHGYRGFTDLTLDDDKMIEHTRFDRRYGQCFLILVTREH
jgi:hypothetical protein